MNTRSCYPEFAQAVASSGWSHCEVLIKQFEDAWNRGENPAIADYLLPNAEVRRALLVELIHVDLEFRIKARSAAYATDYLTAYPELADLTNAVVDLVAAEIKLRRRFEAQLDLDEYAARFPDLDRRTIEALAADTGASRVASNATRLTLQAEWPAVPGYDIVAHIGHGGMGVVYQAHEPKLDRFVALKFLPSDYGRSTDRFERFLHEARTASALNHPYICTVHALGEHEGRPYLVMEFIAGHTLRSVARTQPHVADVARWISQAAQALAAAHAAGVVHRDIKPENVMVRDDGFVKVLDFGLARRLPSFVTSTNTPPETNPGAMLGTISYMSPEQSRGEEVKSPSDIFSLGIVTYELLAAVHPFEAPTPVGMLHAIATAAAPPIVRTNPHVPAALSNLVAAMLHKDPALRPTAAEVVRALDSIDDRSPVTRPNPKRSAIVRREAELFTLRKALSDAEAGRGSMACVVGEPGIGKTTLVEEFLSEIDDSTSLLLARGNCSERLADTEAYLPVFDALESLLRGDRSGSAARLLKAVAPTWCAQIAPAAADTADLASRSLASSQPAILREFVGFLQEATRFGTLVLFFDDVHWADLSTVDLLAHVGRLCPTLRVLIIATYRPTEMLLGRHPFRNVKLDLQAKGICTEVTLGFLGRRDVARYLDLAFPGHQLAADFAELIHSRTEGSPLFMADLLRYLCESGTLAEVDGHWRIARELPDLSRELPESIRGMIQRKLDRLDDFDRQVLSAASVQGHAFDSQIVADALGSVPSDVEDRLQALDRVHGLVRMLHDHELPDRSLSLRYAFVHILYQQALYHELLPTRRAWLSLSIARALAKRHGDSTPSVTAELAYLYEAGRDFMESARQFWQASNNAARVFAHSEAISLARRGLKLLDDQPASPECNALQLKLETTLGMQLQMTQGYAAPAAQQAYERARARCNAASQESALFPVLWGLWLVHKVRSNLGTARLLAEELAALARKLNDPDLSLQAHQALGMTAFCRGEPETSLQHVEQGVALYDPRRHLAHAFQFGQDPSVICKGFGAVVLWLLGYPDAAARQCDSAIAISKNLSPSSQTVALFFAAMVHRLRRDVERSREFATACGQVAAEHGLSFWMAGSTLLGGTTSFGVPRNPCDTIRQGLVEWQATGSVTYRTFFLGLLAEALLEQGQIAEAIVTLDEALRLAETTAEHFYTAELNRLRGEAKLSHSTDADQHNDAEHDFRRALAIAQDQQANSLALRAAVSLTKLYPQTDSRSGKSLGTLSSIFNQFTEGFATADVQHAAKLLELGRD